MNRVPERPDDLEERCSGRSVRDERGQHRRRLLKPRPPRGASPPSFVVVATEIDHVRDSRGGVERGRQEEQQRLEFKEDVIAASATRLLLR